MVRRAGASRRAGPPKKPRAAGVGLGRRTKPLAESIRELRRELGLTQVALAEKTGAAATSIQHYETGSRSPDCHTLARMAIAAYKASKLEAAEALARHLPGFDDIFVPRWWLKGGGPRQVEVLIKDEEN